MCLTIAVEADAGDREALSAAAKQAEGFGLHVDLEHPSRWPWAKRRPVRAEITEDGGCGCSLLSDDADWDAETWLMRPDVVERLARTLEALVERGPARMRIEALWAGDRPEKEMQVKADDLAALVRSTGLGTRVRYVVERAG